MLDPSEPQRVYRRVYIFIFCTAYLMAFTLPLLPYAYDALEPAIDARTMEIHHTKHHNAYLTNLNTALQWTEYEQRTIQDLLKNISTLPEQLKGVVRNHGGGFYNHSLFWEWMTPGGSTPSATLVQMLTTAFGSVEQFQDLFTKAATTQFGSWWARLVKKADGSLAVYGLPNQDSPLTQWDAPLLGLDVWEHAYYLHYQNLRADYIKNRWTVVNRKKVEECLAG